MMCEYSFNFGNVKSSVCITDDLPCAADVTGNDNYLIVCDSNTEFIARRIFDKSGQNLPQANICILKPGETGKNWDSAEAILGKASRAGLDRSSVFIGAGGGVVSDLTAFAASVYMRGVRVRLVSTTLLGMVDASVGGKTGFDLFGIKNLVGTFYPAEKVFIPVSSLDSLPKPEWKSGMAELIKTAVLAGDDFLAMVKTLKTGTQNLGAAIAKAVEFKGRIVEEDPKETGHARILLNLGHTFGHALESSVGFGKISHGEAVAWGMARSCELGLLLGITSKERVAQIADVLRVFEYNTKTPYPGMDIKKYMEAIVSDKKIKSKKLRFIIPTSFPTAGLTAGTASRPAAAFGAQTAVLEDFSVLERLINGEYSV
ncbi:MAG: 3-dehydroquinate synthase [Treponema sp.]|nr:3-dehydroquinate synthase [Treponema sp.]